MENDKRPEIENLNVLDQAIAKRIIIEHRRYNSDAQKAADPFPKLVAQITPLLTESFADPQTAKINLAKSYKIINAPSAYFMHSLNEEERLFAESTEFFLSNIYEASAEVLESGFVKIIEEKEKAIEIATERGINPQDMYENEQLYTELVKSYETPESFSKRQFGDIKSIAQMMPAVFTESMEQFIDLKTGNQPEEEGPFANAAKAFAAALIGNEENNREIELLQTGQNAAENYKKESLINLSKEVVRIWGNEAITQIPQEIRNEILQAYLETELQKYSADNQLD